MIETLAYLYLNSLSF